MLAAVAVPGVTRASAATSPNPNQLNAVSCTSATFCMAVGAAGLNPSARKTLAETWNGKAWTIRSTPNPSGAEYSLLSGVSCTSAKFCVAVGDGAGTGTLIEQWNGTSWKIANANETKANLKAVSCSAANACTAVGYTEPRANLTYAAAERWNGSTWTVQHPPTGPDYALFGVSCPKAKRTVCVAVGQGKTGEALAERWNGKTWSIQKTPTISRGQPDLVLNSVSCTSPGSCDAVGSRSTETSSAGTPRVVAVAERWNNTDWKLWSVPTPAKSGEAVLNGASCAAAANACEAVGYHETSHLLTMADFWNGHSWKQQTTPNPPGASSFRGVSCVSERDCVAVGATLSEVWNGKTWTIHSTPK